MSAKIKWHTETRKLSDLKEWDKNYLQTLCGRGYVPRGTSVLNTNQ